MTGWLRTCVGMRRKARKGGGVSGIPRGGAAGCSQPSGVPRSVARGSANDIVAHGLRKAREGGGGGARSAARRKHAAGGARPICICATDTRRAAASRRAVARGAACGRARERLCRVCGCLNARPRVEAGVHLCRAAGMAPSARRRTRVAVSGRRFRQARRRVASWTRRR